MPGTNPNRGAPLPDGDYRVTYLLREIGRMRRAMQEAGMWDAFCVAYARFTRRRQRG